MICWLFGGYKKNAEPYDGLSIFCVIVFGPLLLAFEVGDVLEHGVDVAVDFVALAPAVYATYYQTYNAADDYAE